MIKYSTHLKSGWLAAVVLTSAATLTGAAESAGKPLFLDTTQPFDKRTADLISRLTLEEKAMLLNHRGTTVERFGIRQDRWNQCLHGVWWNRPTTLFPIPLAMSATWDTSLVHQVATVISDEARAIYNGWHLDANFPGEHKGLIYRAPVINIERNPYWGRNEEAWSEDPFLTGRMGVAFVKGMQGNDPKYLKLVSTLKHYAVNNVERGRQSLSVTVNERMLHEYWLPHFRDCIIEGQAQSVMASYNAINGTPNNINKVLLTDILKDQWGFKGFVVSDLGGVQSMVRGHERGQMTYEDAVAKSLIAGCDFSDREFETYLPAAVRKGLLPESRLNDALYRVLYNRFRLGEFDPFEMVPYSRISTNVICSPEHRALALKVAQQSIVLLANRDNFLPLDKTKLKKIAVIGPHANTFTKGNYYGNPSNPITPLQGIRNRAARDTEILYARGCAIRGADVATQVDRENGFSGGASVKVSANAPGDFIQFTVDVPAAGAYEIRLRFKSFSERGTYRLSIDGTDHGPPVDMYSATTDYDRLLSLGTATFANAGSQLFKFIAVGKNAASGSFAGHFDSITLSGATNVTFEAENLRYTTGVSSGAQDTISDAANLARGADVAIVFVGTDNAIEMEGRDRTTLALPGSQDEMVRAVHSANPKTVVVLLNAGPLAIPWIKQNISGILEAWWNGAEGGNAIADVLFGDVNPGGKLPQTVYASEDQVPSQDEYDISKGFTYMYLRGEPLFAFGHGLSYTTFKYGELSLSGKQIGKTGNLAATIEVSNSGQRSGDEVVQLYVRDLESSVKRPIRELRGFERVHLRPGESRKLTFAVPAAKLAFYDEVRHDFVVESGEFEIQVGSSSEDIRRSARFQVQ